jgi:hypothetical protein
MHWAGWGIPNDMPVPPGGDGPVPPWTDLKFNPLGIYNLRRRLGALCQEPGVFMHHKDRFLSSDIAWFSGGLHNDGQHSTSRDTFHSLFHTARDNTGTGEPATKLRNKLRDSVCDLMFDTVSFALFLVMAYTQINIQATLWDRAYGGYTMVLHVDGTTPPKALATPEHLKAHVYLPPNLITEFPDSHEPIARIVQSFIEAVGVPTVMRWRRAAVSNGWSLSQTQSGIYSTPAMTHLPLIPEPVRPTSSYYVFPGRPYGSLQSTTQHSSSDTHPSIRSMGNLLPPSQHDADYRDHGSLYEDPQLELAQVLDENSQLKEELQQALEREAKNEAVIKNLRRGLRELVERQEGPGRDEGLSVSTQIGGPIGGLPKIRTTSNNPSSVTTSRPFASPTTTRTTPAPPQRSPTRHSASHHPSYQNPSSPSKPRVWPAAVSHQVHFPESHTPSSPGFPLGGLQSFGPLCETFIEENALGDRLHRRLWELFESTLTSKWHQTIIGWFSSYDEETALHLADGLYHAMCHDSKAKDEY